MSKRFEGRVVVVTGAAGGIGRATVERFARDGARVVATDLKDAPIEETAAAVEKIGGEVLTAAHDVSCWDDWQRIVSESESRFGGIDYLVNNAGIEGAVSTIEESPEALFDQVMAVNVKGVFLGMKAVIPELRKRGGGAIVNLAESGLGDGRGRRPDGRTLRSEQARGDRSDEIRCDRLWARKNPRECGRSSTDRNPYDAPARVGHGTGRGGDRQAGDRATDPPRTLRHAR